jgi:hypothetical protein
VWVETKRGRGDEASTGSSGAATWCPEATGSSGGPAGVAVVVVFGGESGGEAMPNKDRAGRRGGRRIFFLACVFFHRNRSVHPPPLSHLSPLNLSAVQIFYRVDPTAT